MLFFEVSVLHHTKLKRKPKAVQLEVERARQRPPAHLLQGLVLEVFCGLRDTPCPTGPRPGSRQVRTLQARCLGVDALAEGMIGFQ